MKDLSLRVASAVVLIAGAVYLVGFSPGWLFFAFHTLFLILMTWELGAMLEQKYDIGSKLVPVTAAVVWNLLYLSPDLTAPVATAILMLLFGFALAGKRENAVRFQALVLLIFASIYPAVLWRPLLSIRELPGGIRIIAFLLLLNFGTDTAAYFGGKLLGRRPFSPQVSPKKTWEGLLAGMLGAAALSLVSSGTFLPMTPARAIAFGCAVAVLGQMSDLSESLVKRACGVKDSGSIIPGHGGLLDRCDSLLFNIPVVWYVWSRPW
ncbi:MAG: phosphatidate cytidylyltransferase [Acidobacteriota bacterium]